MNKLEDMEAYLNWIAVLIEFWHRLLVIHEYDTEMPADQEGQVDFIQSALHGILKEL